MFEEEGDDRKNNGRCTALQRAAGEHVHVRCKTFLIEGADPSESNAAIVSSKPSVCCEFQCRRCAMTSVTPSTPSARPHHCRAFRRSPRTGAAPVATTSGESAMTSAIIATGMPSVSAM